MAKIKDEMTTEEHMRFEQGLQENPVMRKCEACNGLGEVSTMETLSASEPHLQAPVGSETCETCNGTGQVEHIIEIGDLDNKMEDILKEIHGKNYSGTDDDMPEAYERWLETLSQYQLHKYLGL